MPESARSRARQTAHVDEPRAPIFGPLRRSYESDVRIRSARDDDGGEGRASLVGIGAEAADFIRSVRRSDSTSVGRDHERAGDVALFRFRCPMCDHGAREAVRDEHDRGLRLRGPRDRATRPRRRGPAYPSPPGARARWPCCCSANIWIASGRDRNCPETRKNENDVLSFASPVEAYHSGRAHGRSKTLPVAR